LDPRILRKARRRGVFPRRRSVGPILVVTMQIPKPEPRRVQKARERREAAAARAACLEVVWTRAGGRCEVCGRAVKRATDPTLGSVFEVGHGHEIVSRARGGRPDDPANVRLCCILCHQRAHGLRVAE